MSSPDLSTDCFYVRARAEPGVMPRLLQLFVKRGLVPGRWHSATAGPGGGELHVDIEMPQMAMAPAAQIAAAMRQLADVKQVLLSPKASLAAA